MSALVETVSKEAQLPIPRTYSLEASSRSTMDRCPHAYIQQGWHLGPTREHALVFYQDALRGFDRALAAQAAALTVTSLPVHTICRRVQDFDFDFLVKALLDRVFLTQSVENLAVAIHLTDPMTPTPELQPRETGAGPELKRSLGRLNYLRTLADGWLGEDSLAASEVTGKEAEDLLKRLRREAPAAPLPVLGLDTDGTIVMSWSEDGLTGSMTIYGDGTYSYFVRRNGEAARDTEAAINEPIAEALRTPA